jgi:hypothetical protein
MQLGLPIHAKSARSLFHTEGENFGSGEGGSKWQGESDRMPQSSALSIRT